MKTFAPTISAMLITDFLFGHFGHFDVTLVYIITLLLNYDISFPQIICYCFLLLSL